MLSDHHYILIGKNPVAIPQDQFLNWGMWFEWNSSHRARHVGSLRIPPRKPFRKGNSKMLRKINALRAQEIFVSTVFLGINHNHFDMHGKNPILFETMIFGGKHDGYQTRYFTWDQAEDGHKEAVAVATKGMVL